MGTVKDKILKLPFINKIAEKWHKINTKVTKLQQENKQLKNELKELKLEVRELEVIREIEQNAIRKFQRETKLPDWYLDRPKVSIIVVNHNGREHLLTLLKSMVKAVFYDNYEMILVDNASTDDSIGVLAEFEKKIPIKVIKNTENLSFSEANNIGAREADGEYLLFMNNDTEVTDGWLDELLYVALKEEKVGAVGARLVYPRIPKDSTNVRKAFTIQHEGIAFRKAVRAGVQYLQPYNMGNGKTLLQCQAKETIERACVTAAVLLVEKEKFVLCGGYDEQYLYGYEDVDLCLKLYEKGFRNYYCPHSLVFHYEFGTQSTDEPNAVKERRIKNMYVFVEKWQEFLEGRVKEEEATGRHLFTEISEI